MKKLHIQTARTEKQPWILGGMMTTYDGGPGMEGGFLPKLGRQLKIVCGMISISVCTVLQVRYTKYVQRHTRKGLFRQRTDSTMM
jgi:hypothetical protein